MTLVPCLPCSFSQRVARASGDQYDTVKVERVDFFAYGGKIASAYSFPFAATWDSCEPGEHSLMARGYGILGDAWDSDLVRIVMHSNTPPSIAVVSPEDGYRCSTKDDLVIEAAAEDSDGKVDFVVFFIDGDQISDDHTPPYQLKWRPLEPGDYAVGARSVDDGWGASPLKTIGVSVDKSKHATGAGRETRTQPR